MIIDSQIHLWKPETVDRPWPPGGAQRAHLKTALSYEMMLRAMDEADVDAAIIVPPSWEGDRNDYALEAAQKHPRRFAVMGRIDLDQSRDPQLLPHWRDAPGMLGVRLTVPPVQRKMLCDGDMEWFWMAAETANIPIMVYYRESISAELACVASRHTGLKLIIDHFGITEEAARKGQIGQAIEEIAALAEHQNVSVKLSSAPRFSREHYPYLDIRPYIRRLVEAFGARRCFWGTDMTRSMEKCSYRQRVTHFTEELDFLSDDDKKWIMGRGLAECLGWSEMIEAE